MKKWMKLVMVIALFSVILVMGCKDDTTDSELTEFEILVEYLEDGNDDFEGWVNNLDGWILETGVLNEDFDYSEYTVFDLRSADDFNEMHIEDAINLTMGEMLDEAANVRGKILVTCYSGQSASYAHMLLRMKGYEAYVMKFGMSVYDESLDKWSDNCSSAYVDDFVMTESPALPEFNYPELNVGSEDAVEILDARIEAAIELWSNSQTTPLILADEVMSDPSLYNIMNYWGDGDDNGTPDYLQLGHIDGAYELAPKTLTQAENLSVFDPDGYNIFYCYTGQTAAASIAYLTVLGYDVKSIKFGTCAVIYDQMPGPKWPDPWAK